MSETTPCPTFGGGAHIGRTVPADGAPNLSAVTDEQKSKKIGQLKKAFQASRVKLEKAEARIPELEQQLSDAAACKDLDFQPLSCPRWACTGSCLSSAFGRWPVPSSTRYLILPASHDKFPA